MSDTMILATELFTKCGLMEEAKALLDSERNSGCHYGFRYQNRLILVKSTADQTMDAVALLTVPSQEKLMTGIMENLRDPGDSTIIISDWDPKKKHQSAHVVRLKDDAEGNVKLLITR